MMNPWTLPVAASIGGAKIPINSDYRDVLEIISYLNDIERPEYVRWEIAIGLFYEEDILPKYKQEAMQFLADFIACGEQETSKKPPVRLIDWEQDSLTIIADVNKVAGTEIRSLPFLHWWTFVAYFRGIGEGQLSTLVSIRDKLARGKKLESWEKDYYRENKSRVDLKKRYSAEELAEQERLKKILGE